LAAGEKIEEFSFRRVSVLKTQKYQNLNTAEKRAVLGNTMKKKQQSRQSTAKVTKKRVIIYGTIGAIIAAIAVSAYSSSVPVNVNYPVFGFANNHFIRASYSQTSGYVWVSASSGSVKGMRGSNGAGVENPTYIFNKGELESLHITNDDQTTHSLHNFNINEFNVHTANLTSFGSQSQTITFLADKTGTFNYYCQIHPEMKGEITIQ
jgi:plastocyanin